MNPNNHTVGYQIGNISNDEITTLKTNVLGYGKFKKVASKSTGMHQYTFRNIFSKRFRLPENVQAVKEKLVKDIDINQNKTI